jgi:hypothetical protein
MDNFTLAVVVSDIVMILAMIALILVDRKKPVMGPVKTTGNRPA